MTISKNLQIGVSKKVIKMPKAPGSTRMKDGKIPIIERTAYNIFHHGRLLSFALEYQQFNQLIFKLKTAEKDSSKGIPKSVTDGVKGPKIAAPMNILAAIGTMIIPAIIILLI